MAVKDYDLDQPMAQLIDLAVKKFGEVEFQTVAVGDVSIEVLQIKNMQQYIDKLMDKTRSGKKVGLPLWAKIWPSSVVLGFSLSRFPLPDGSRVLEIGGGSAVNGLVMASRGFDVTVVDNDPDAVLFSRINALKNGLEEHVSCVRSDFKTVLDTSFDCIVACEMLYEAPTFDVMADFINNSLTDAESAEVFLSLDLKRAAKGFFAQSNEYFNIMNSKAKYKDQDTGDEKDVNLFRFKRKSA
ncbi:methyltransferase domain-containing protein [Pseudodesulfovibrio sp.]|nr:methyltransferase domain-containing protein [Pseudodesulfovibrio sp.]